MDEFKDEFGYFSDIDAILDSSMYKDLDIKGRNDLLLEIIMNNNKIANSINNEVEKSNKERFVVNHNEKKSKEKYDKIDKGKNKFTIDSSLLENSSDIELFLPEKDDVYFSEKINLLKCNLYLIIDKYNTMLRNIKNNEDRDIENYILECIKNTEDKLEIVNNYCTEEIELKPVENLNILYFKYKGTNLVLKDILDEDIDKYDVYYNLIQSLKEQKFKSIKKLKIGIYELRASEQRLIFDKIDQSTIIIIYLFTKKIFSSKKYRYDIDKRCREYQSVKEEIKTNLKEKRETLLEEHLKDDELLINILKTKSKKLIKELKKV